MTWSPTHIIRDRYELLTLKRDRPGHQVWLALDRQSQTKVIIKTLAFTGNIQWDDVKLFEREISILKRLNHPRIPAFVDAFNLEQPHFQKCLVESYIYAPSLQDFLDRKQPIPPGQIWAIATQMLNILHDLHALHPPILHRDLKPSNILLTADKTVYLIDFGAAGMPGGSNPESGDAPTMVSSFGYTPTEQLMGQGSPASDLYALGATIMALLSGTHPAELMTPKLQLALPLDISLPAPLRQWLHQLTAPEVNHRFSTAAQALQQLQQAQTLARTLAEASDEQQLSVPMGKGRITTAETDQSSRITIAPLWNPQTIATKDVLLLSGLAVLPPCLAVLWAIALSGSAPGFGVLSTDLLLLGLGGVPSLLIGPKLFWKLLKQEIETSPTQITIKRKIAGITIQSRSWNQRDVASFHLRQTKAWDLMVMSPSNQLKYAVRQLSSTEIDGLYQTLEQWRLSSDR